MKCAACGSEALVEGRVQGDDGSSPSFYPSDMPLLRRMFGIGGRGIRAYGCVHCGHLQLTVDFREDDRARHAEFEGEQPGVLERINAEPEGREAD
jgi:hypothetical protein